MNNTTPLKRSPELQPLSREHHEGLLFVWKIRQGLKNNIPMDKLRVFTGWYWKHHIRPHFFQEEKILMPCMPEHPLMTRMRSEHDFIRELIIEIDKDPQRGDLIQLADLIEKHIRFEERELFPCLEELLTKEQLVVILKQLEDHPVSHEVFKDDPFIHTIYQ